MSMFKVDVAIGNLDGGDLAPVQPVVDMGAAHSMLPESLMTHAEDRTPMSSLGFILADGTRLKYGYGFARFSIGGDESDPARSYSGRTGITCWARRRWGRSTWWSIRWASSCCRRSGCRWDGADRSNTNRY